MATDRTDLPLRIGVIGASGFIGQHIYQRLAARPEWSVTGYSSRTCNLLDAQQTACALRDFDADSTLVLCSAIGRTTDDSFDALLRNTCMVQNLLESVADRALRSVIYLSSVDVYGRPPRVVPTSESDPLEPTEYYGIAKLACESLLRMRLVPRVPVALLRIPGIYGPGDGGRSVVGSLVRRVKDRQVLELSGDGSALRDYLEVGDVAAVVEALVERPYTGTLNVASGRSVSLQYLAEATHRALGVSPQVQLRPDLDSRGSLVWDVRRLRSLLPEFEFTSIEDGIARYIETTHDAPV